MHLSTTPSQNEQSDKDQKASVKYWMAWSLLHASYRCLTTAAAMSHLQGETVWLWRIARLLFWRVVLGRGTCVRRGRSCSVTCMLVAGGARGSAGWRQWQLSVLVGWPTVLNSGYRWLSRCAALCSLMMHWRCDPSQNPQFRSHFQTWSSETTPPLSTLPPSSLHILMTNPRMEEICVLFERIQYSLHSQERLLFLREKR